ncbi:MAG: M15 family metallopeptidase, partial [Cytophagales bacterium]|nr:M15 family metallopeptidase [Cytophagales bacterium]
MIESEFFISPLSENRIESIRLKTEWTTDSPVSLERIREVHFGHIDFNENVSHGQMIVLDILAESVLEIFRELLAVQFPIQKAIPIDKFNGDDEASMEVNNSSAFNARRVMNTDRWSSHAYGAAIDINPTQNPY